jgi:AAA15 family ATPase/GTPase
MLIQVTLENVLSFKDATTFSMLGVKDDLGHPEHLIRHVVGEDRALLPVAAIYGANGAGKSNLIKAISFARDLIVEGTRSRQTIPVSPFKLSGDRQKNSRFEFNFSYKGAFYSYGFVLNHEQIFEEWLYGVPPGQTEEILFFERDMSDQKEAKVEFGEILQGEYDQENSFLEFVAKGTRPNQLFLTESVDRNVEKLAPVLEWFLKTLLIVTAEPSHKGFQFGFFEYDEFVEFVSDFLKSSGTGIDSIGVNKVTLNLDEINTNLVEVPANIREELIQNLAESEEGSGFTLENTAGEQYYSFIKEKNNQISLMQLKTQHQHEQGQLIDFAIHEESEGTQRLINLVPALFFLKKGREKVVLLDELDRRLHPLLSRQFLAFFLTREVDSNQNQLVFTTHDTNLLDLDLLRRDEIWFVEKDRQGSSSLYSLADFKIRSDLNVDKGYLNGRFGAIPFLGDIASLGWLDHESDPASAIDSRGQVEDWDTTND